MDSQYRNASRNDLILSPLGWFKADRNGELDLKDVEDAAPCHECGQPLDWPWIGILSNGAIHGPVCTVCATRSGYNRHLSAGLEVFCACARSTSARCA